MTFGDIALLFAEKLLSQCGNRHLPLTLKYYFPLLDEDFTKMLFVKSLQTQLLRSIGEMYNISYLVSLPTATKPH